MKTLLNARRAWLSSLMLLLLAIVPIAATATGQPYYLTLFIRVMIYGLAAVSLNLILGYGGMVSLGHALYLGLGAYAMAILSHFGITSGWAHLAVALAVAVPVAALTGVISVRATGAAFIMITLAFAQMFFFLAVSMKFFGGDEGMTVDHRSYFGPLDLHNQVLFYYLVFALMIGALYLSRRVLESRFGMILRGSMGNERRMRALGFPTLRYRVTAYVISACLCTVAGVLLANLTKFASPDYLSWARSGDLIVMVALGGMGTLIGPVVGATTYLLLEHVLSAFTEHWMIVLGPIVVLISLVGKRGIVGLLCRGEGRPAVKEAILSVRNLVKSFGGVLATDHLCLEVTPGEIHAVIGPNGAGKTTLISQVAGELPPDSGRILFEGHDITSLPPHRRALRGLARSYQITSVFTEFTALQNVALSVQAHQGHGFRFWKPVYRSEELLEPAREALASVGLAGRMDAPVSELGHGERRQLELAMVLASKPKVVLLDEPMAGMSAQESQAMTNLLSSLKGRFTMVLVEHDMEAVFALADRICVLVYGKVIACGAPEQIRTDPEVRQAYLGEEGARDFLEIVGL